MTIEITTYNYWDLLDQTNQTRENCDRPNDPDEFWKYPPQLGRGSLRIIQLRSGLALEIFEVEQEQDLLIEFHPHRASLEFVFKLAGISGDDEMLTKPGQDYIFGGVYTKGQGLRSAGKTFEVCVHIEPDTLRRLIEGYSEPIPSDLEQAIEGAPEQPSFRPSLLTPAKQIALHQILHCPYQGLTRKVYLESKALELIALKLASETLEDKKSSNSFILRPQDIDRIYHARDILIRDLENPPSLLALSRQVGLNTHKLKVGFRQVFNTTVFGYLYAHRMEQARWLLEERKMTVAEVAYAVGYANRSHFAAAFRKRFGINPRDY